MKQFIVFVFFVHISSAQVDDSTRFLRGQITATNNGVSLIPSFSLGKPAVLFDMNMGKGRLSFDPMLRFGMNAKPWAFVFWWRYKMIQQNKFNLGIGAHPSVVFRDVALVNNGVSKNYLTAQRYFAWEAAPIYVLNKNLNFGLYYLGSKGLTKDVIQNTVFLAAKTGINLPTNKYRFGLIPQVYYLKMDANDGFYTNITANIYKKQFPVSINLIASKALKTEITGKSFLWSAGLVYNLNNSYLKKK